MAIGNTAKWTGIYGSTPKADIAQIAAAEFVKGKPAQIQPATLTFAALADHASSTYKHYLSVGEEFIAAVTQLRARYKEGYATWNLCCGAVFGASPEAVQTRIRRIEQSLPFNADTDVVPVVGKVNEKCLSSIEKAREMADLDRAQEPEKPHIRTATEVLAGNGEVKKATENGTPKNQLAIWSKAEGIGGAFLRAVDDINRLCPNKAFHDHTLDTIKEAMRATREWRSTVK